MRVPVIQQGLTSIGTAAPRAGSPTSLQLSHGAQASVGIQAQRVAQDFHSVRPQVTTGVFAQRTPLTRRPISTAVLQRIGQAAVRPTLTGGGVWARFVNLIKGLLGMEVNELERANPEAVYQQAIDARIAQHQGLKQSSARLLLRRDATTAKLNEKIAELAQTEMDLTAAVAADKDDLALLLIPKKEALEKEVADLRDESTQWNKDAEAIKGNLLKFEGEIQALRAEMDRNLAKMASAKARLAIQESLNGLSVEADVQALTNVRESIAGLEAQANLGDELNGASLDTQLAELRAKSQAESSRAKLQELKAARAGQAAGQKTI